MRDTFPFSVTHLLKLTGKTAAEKKYIKQYIQECLSRINASAKLIDDFADGKVIFNNSTLETVYVQIGIVRFHSAALLQGISHFGDFQEIAQIFESAYSTISDTVQLANTQAQFINNLINSADDLYNN